MAWFLYDRDLRHERVNFTLIYSYAPTFKKTSTAPKNERKLITSKLKVSIIYLIKETRDLFHTTQNIKFSMKVSFSKCDQIRRKLGIWSYLLKKSLMENFIFVQCHILFSKALTKINDKIIMIMMMMIIITIIMITKRRQRQKRRRRRRRKGKRLMKKLLTHLKHS